MKLKIKQKKDRTTVQITLQKDEEIINRELTSLSANVTKNLFRPSLKKGVLFFGDTLEYIGPRCIPLTQYLKKTISKQNFYYILTQVVSVIHYLQSVNMSRKNLLLDLRYIFINVNTNEVFLLYLPVLSNRISSDALDFFGTLLHSVNPDRNENNGYLGEFSNFLKSQSSYSTEQFQSFICRQDNFAAAQFKRLMGGQSGFITNNRGEYYDHYQGTNAAENGQSRNVFAGGCQGNEDTTLLNQDNAFYDMPGNDFSGSEGTTALNSFEDVGTTILNENQNITYSQQHFPYLIRLSSGERIEIDKPAFRLGKENRFVDYFVSNNDAVSRSHADIITRSGHYYVIDLHTTNYTYINGSMLPSDVEVEIFDGNILKLANEEFEFHVQ